jgi:hypothetical protein
VRPALLLPDAAAGAGPADKGLTAAGPAGVGLTGPVAAADLGLDAVYDAMARGDRVVEEVARRIVPLALRDGAALRYRQAVVADVFADPGLARELLALASEAVDRERAVWGGALRNPEMVLDRAAEVIDAFTGLFRRLRDIVAAHGPAATSDGVRAFCGLVERELDDAFLAEAAAHAQRLRERVLHVGAHLGPGNRGAGYVLHRPPPRHRTWRDRVGLDESRGMTVEVQLRDANGMNMVADLRAQAVAPTAAAAHDAADRMLGFWRALRDEAAFLVGTLNLRDALDGVGASWCHGELRPAGEPGMEASGIYDPALALALGRAVTGNDIHALGRGLVVVTGANGGGKSTLLRAIGLAQVMLQAGLPVAATSFAADLRSGVLTHFVRDDEAPGREGRLDEELGRLALVLEDADMGSMVLLNETLSTANEREGTEIALGVVTALADAGVRVWYVTHLHGLASRLEDERGGSVLFLRAERGTAGVRSFLVTEAKPLATAFGMDVYRRVMGDPAALPAPGTPRDPAVG